MPINWFDLIFGFVVGALATGFAIWKLMPGMMLVTHESRLPFDETVETFIQHAQEMGWQVPKVYELQNSLAKAGHQIPPLKVVSLCQPHYAFKVLEKDENKRISAIMPCRIGIYEKSNGKTYISEMNIALMSKMFGPAVASAMASVSAEEEAMLKGIVAHK